MMRHRVLTVVYGVLAVVGLVGTWGFNVAAVVAGRDYLGDWLGSGPSVSSLVVDVLVVLVVVWVLMLVEARRLGIRRVWVYLLLAPVVAVAFALPLFLAVRERRLAQLGAALPAGRRSEPGGAPSPGRAE